MTEPAPIHLKPQTELASGCCCRAIPHRALAVAQDVARSAEDVQPPPRALGLHGTAPDGALLTVQATGMGGPSAAIVIEELIVLGARRLVRDRDLRRA